MAPWHLYLMGILYILAGIMHFARPKMYQRIIPDYLPNAKFLVILSGIAEILLGLGLFFEADRTWAAIGIICMLIAFLPVHFYMLANEKAAMGIPKWVLILRIPLQFGLMYWAYNYVSF
ncbi:MauE/DoxX family redox-associated membrane protein [Flagellimonas sediminis]|uniref:DoxX family membrane protein n=1 Tax=Flagellimonas sediminis TaxID=2696468 RepID=A0A6I5L3U2_9FLAO|nr:MauE/DoxX family redox-associated membrane protein [Allomuricauda sediminis]NDV45142.1 DoxX family membrane protein [Allomuricauda sediminis]